MINKPSFIYFSLYFFLKKFTDRLVCKKFKLIFYNNSTPIIKPTITNKIFYSTVNNNLYRLLILLQNIFYLNKNVLFVDSNFNFNYLPITNTTIFSRSSKNFKKYLKYFNVSVVFFFNLNKKKFIFKKLFSSKVINASLDKKTYLNKFDLNLSLPQNKLTYYIIYVAIMDVYIKIKNKNLKKNGTVLFFL